MADGRPYGPVIRTLKPARNGSAAMHASCGPETRLPPATMAASMRSRWWPGDAFYVEDRDRHKVQL